ncbi:MAG: 16S rRNA (cytosine(1402)-N(4))-methyltransferase RsmH [Halobacteriovoraceae bacterium]|jgi:16S rRNA (cytosine1402-N4)-methyltransferase|nr:16S rRNA (cytosine(1402)-N(4))-methyltransferase RsmH [Halobacteriovoraceae bacterium]
MEYTSHYSVLKKECLNFLSTDAPIGAVFADLTFGGGGHSLALAQLDDSYTVIGVDQDPEARENGQKRIKELGLEARVKIIPSNFVHFPARVQEHLAEGKKLQGILLDLGVSSHHFDSAERGFSFRFEGPLDMRMDPSNNEILTAADIINSYSAKELQKIFSEYGEERFSKSIAEKIVEVRSQKLFETTKELEDVIFHMYPKKLRHGRANPSTKVFQALRIEVNRELTVLSEVIPQLLPLLDIGGSLAIISFHSLEDRIVKHSFKALEEGPLPCSIETKKPVLPSIAEINENSRSRSAKLRVLKRVKEKKGKNKYPKKS